MKYAQLDAEPQNKKHNPYLDLTLFLRAETKGKSEVVPVLN
jgi:hypothetical protein